MALFRVVVTEVLCFRINIHSSSFFQKLVFRGKRLAVIVIYGGVPVIYHKGIANRTTLLFSFARNNSFFVSTLPDISGTHSDKGALWQLSFWFRGFRVKDGKFFLMLIPNSFWQFPVKGSIGPPCLRQEEWHQGAFSWIFSAKALFSLAKMLP